MAFQEIFLLQIEVGDPVTKDLWDKVKYNFDDHENRISDLEATVLKFQPISFEFIGNHAEYGADRGYPVTNLHYHVIEFNVDLIGCTLLTHLAGSGGTTEIDIQRLTLPNTWTSIFTGPGRPKVTSTSNYQKSAAATFAITTLSAGDVIRFVLIQSQSGSPNGFSVYLSIGAA